MYVYFHIPQYNLVDYANTQYQFNQHQFFL